MTLLAASERRRPARRYSSAASILDGGPYSAVSPAAIISAMSDRQSTEDRGEPGRYVLLPEDPATTAGVADSSHPRIRRYRLARFGGDGDARRGGERRPASDFAYLRRAHD